jgi:hypothetical protein
LVIRIYAGAAVFNLDQKVVPAIGLDIETHGHPTLLGELDGIADQIDENLAQTGLIAFDIVRKSGRLNQNQ